MTKSSTPTVCARARDEPDTPAAEPFAARLRVIHARHEPSAAARARAAPSGATSSSAPGWVLLTTTRPEDGPARGRSSARASAFAPGFLFVLSTYGTRSEAGCRNLRRDRPPSAITARPDWCGRATAGIVERPGARRRQRARARPTRSSRSSAVRLAQLRSADALWCCE